MWPRARSLRGRIALQEREGRVGIQVEGDERRREIFKQRRAQLIGEPGVLADERMPIADAFSPADRALRIDDADIVVVAGPVDAAVEHRCSPSPRPACDGLMDEPSWGDTLPVRSGSDLRGSGTV